MNETTQVTYGCAACAGAGCFCGCQQSVSRSGQSACGPQCQCSPACTCAKS